MNWGPRLQLRLIYALALLLSSPMKPFPYLLYPIIRNIIWCFLHFAAAFILPTIAASSTIITIHYNICLLSLHFNVSFHYNAESTTLLTLHYLSFSSLLLFSPRNFSFYNSWTASLWDFPILLLMLLTHSSINPFCQNSLPFFPPTSIPPYK